jgi:hypothetical protein
MTQDTPNAPKTFAAYGEDRAKLNALKAPLKAGFSTGIDQDYRVSQKVEYLLGMVGHLLKRVEELEAQVAAKP